MFGDNKFWEKTFQHRMDQRASNEVSDEGVGAMTQAKAGVVEKGRTERRIIQHYYTFSGRWSNSPLELLG
jgi:hypothetical protein